MKAAWRSFAVALLPLISAAPAPFDNPDYQRVALKDVNIFFRYAGTGLPVMLVYGHPQHSVLTWHTIGPIFAQKYTVNAVDIRGMGQSIILSNGDYTSSTTAEDLNFRYEEVFSRELDESWQLAFFSVPRCGSILHSRAREGDATLVLLACITYSGNSAISEDHLIRYPREISNAGYLRSGLEYFATTLQDAEFFNATLRDHPLQNLTLFLGGESSLAPVVLQESTWGLIASDASYDIVPKAGHWLGDENTEWTADRIASFLGEDDGIPSVDLSYLKNKVTLV